MTDLKHPSSMRKAMAAGQGPIVLAVAVVAALFAGVGVFHAWTHVSVVRAGYGLGQVETAYRELLRENAHLKMERATLRSAPRLEAIARARLGLVPPVASQFVAVKPAGAAPAPAKVTPEKTVAAVTRKELVRNP